MHEASVPKVDTTRTPVSSLIEGDKKIHDRPDLPSWVKKGYKVGSYIVQSRTRLMFIAPLDFLAGNARP